MSVLYCDCQYSGDFIYINIELDLADCKSEYDCPVWTLFWSNAYYDRSRKLMTWPRVYFSSSNSVTFCVRFSCIIVGVSLNLWWCLITIANDEHFAWSLKWNRSVVEGGRQWVWCWVASDSASNGRSNGCGNINTTGSCNYAILCVWSGSW